MQNLQPMKFWVQKVLPLVFDDSLSYYEVLSKVVSKLNDVINNENAQNEFIEQINQNEQNFELNMNQKYQEFITKINEDFSTFTTETTTYVEDFTTNTNLTIENFKTFMANQYTDFLENYIQYLGVTQTTGNSQTLVMSQNAISKILPTLYTNLSSLPINSDLNDIKSFGTHSMSYTGDYLNSPVEKNNYRYLEIVPYTNNFIYQRLIDYSNNKFYYRLYADSNWQPWSNSLSSVYNNLSENNYPNDLNYFINLGMKNLSYSEEYDNCPIPVNNRRLVEVFPITKTYIIQRITDIVNGNIFYRFYVDNIWHPWKSFSYDKMFQLLTSNDNDLNNYNKFGSYVLSYSNDYVNCPISINNRRLLEVFPFSTNYIIQRITNLRNANVYYRYYIDNNWTEWIIISYDNFYNVNDNIDLDLNNYYRFGASVLSYSTDYINCPINKNNRRLLEVLTNSKNYIIQRITDLSLSTIYYRFFVDDNWTEWYSLKIEKNLGDSNINSISQLAVSSSFPKSNLIPFVPYIKSKIHNGITFNFNDDGSIYIHGVASDLAFFDLTNPNFTNYIFPENNKLFTFSLISENAVGAVLRKPLLSSVSTYMIGNELSFTSDNDNYMYSYRIRVNAGTTIDETVYPMLCKGYSTNYISQKSYPSVEYNYNNDNLNNLISSNKSKILGYDYNIKLCNFNINNMLSNLIWYQGGITQDEKTKGDQFYIHTDKLPVSERTQLFVPKNPIIVGNNHYYLKMHTFDKNNTYFNNVTFVDEQVWGNYKGYICYVCYKIIDNNLIPITINDSVNFTHIVKSLGFNNGVTLRVGSHNVRNFGSENGLGYTGLIEYTNCYKRAYLQSNLDLLGIQEYSPFLDRTTYNHNSNNIFSDLFSNVMFVNYRGTVTYGNVVIQNPKQNVFSTTPSRVYITADIIIKNKLIKYVNVHATPSFTAQDYANRQIEYQELIDLTNTYDTFICTGDYNTKEKFELDIFNNVNNKGVLCNNGDIKTCIGVDGLYPCDNIYISKNIVINDCYVYPDFGLSDHRLIIADLNIPLD